MKAEQTKLIYPQKDFPLLKKYQEVFKITPNTIFAYDHKIYTNNQLPKHLLVHEITHHEQQDHYGLDEWVTRYLYDDKFRLNMEIDAYRNQLKSIKDRNFRAKIWMESARNLSSSLYGNIVNYKEAMRLIKVK